MVTRALSIEMRDEIFQNQKFHEIEKYFTKYFGPKNS